MNPEINIAKRMCQKYGLNPPIDIFNLTKKYANIEILNIPFEVDGISTNLKVPGKKPLILLNESQSINRKRFTLAHELGHILIPWHIGTIIDVTNGLYLDKYYSLYESEANRFASELLMPLIWLKSLIEKYVSPDYISIEMSKIAEVSPIAATIRLIQFLEPGYIFAVTDNQGKVLFSGRSEGTIANKPERDTYIDPNKLFPFCKNRYHFQINGTHFYWWQFNDDIMFPSSNDNRNWRKILDGIISDIGLSGELGIKFKKSVNGIIGFANSRVRDSKITKELLFSACLQRFHSKNLSTSFLSHKDFEIFLSKRVSELLNKL